MSDEQFEKEKKEIAKRMLANRIATNEALDKLEGQLSAAARLRALEELDSYMRNSGRVAVAFDEALFGADREGKPVIYLKRETFGDFVVVEPSLVRVTEGDPI